MPYTPDWEKELDKHFPEYFDGAYNEKEDTNLGDELKSFIRSLLQAREEELRGLLKIAKCPDSHCNGSGTGIDGFGEPYQCQWCDERKKALTPKN